MLLFEYLLLFCGHIHFLILLIGLTSELTLTHDKDLLVYSSVRTLNVKHKITVNHFNVTGM